MRVLELAHHPVDDALVPVVAAERGVAGRRLHLEDAVAELEDGHVERAAPEVEHQDREVLLLVEPVGERGGCRLVDDAEHLEARDLAGLLGGLALRVVEVGRHRDHGLRDRVAEVGLRVALELLEDARRDLLGRVALPVDVDRPRRAHVPLHRADRAIRVGDGLTLGDLADEHLAGLREGDDRRGGARPLGVGDDGRLSRLEGRDDGVGRAEVDADGLGHGVLPPARSETLSVTLSTFLVASLFQAFGAQRGHALQRRVHGGPNEEERRRCGRCPRGASSPKAGETRLEEPTERSEGAGARRPGGEATSGASTAWAPRQ